jgi:arylsulfatase A-like enzyme
MIILFAALLGSFSIGRGQNPAPFLTNVVEPLTPVILNRASIVFIQCDGLGRGDLSCYGQTHFQTPNLDRLASDGIRFTNYSAGAAASSPARASLMLGKDSSRVQQRADAVVPLAPDDITVAQILKNSGYHTGLIGEWNLGDENSSGAPWKKGFDEFAGYFEPKDAENFYADYMWRYAPRSIYNMTNRQMDTFVGREPLVPNRGGARREFIPDLLTKAALNFIKVNQPDPFNHYRPFFLLLNYKIPGERRSQVPTDAPFSDEKWPQPAKDEAALVVRVDGYIGQLREQLQKLGLTNDTAIFFTSATPPKPADAAVSSLFHGMVASNDLRVPMIVCWPGHVPAGIVSDFKCSTQDFLPTAAAMGSAKAPADSTGTSVLPVLLGRAAK